MRRAFHHLFTVCSAVSLLISLAVLILWGRSFWKVDHLCFTSGTRSPYAVRNEFAMSGKGRIACWRSEMHATGIVDDDGGPFGWQRASRPVQPDDDMSREVRVRGVSILGFGFLHDGSTTGPKNFIQDFALVVPHAALAIAFAILPTAWLWRRRGGLRRPGHCRTCGYDLRATPGRCPECGTVSQANAAI